MAQSWVSSVLRWTSLRAPEPEQTLRDQALNLDLAEPLDIFIRDTEDRITYSGIRVRNG